MNKPLTAAQLARRTFDFDEAARLYLSGMSLSEVGAQLGKPGELIRKTMHRIGVPLRRRGGGNGEQNHQFKGGQRMRRDGYLIQRGSRKKPLAHRVIAEKALGRLLTEDETVHHINGVKSDNRPENLLICSHAYHMALHARMRQDPYWREVMRQAKQFNHQQRKTTT